MCQIMATVLNHFFLYQIKKPVDRQKYNQLAPAEEHFTHTFQETSLNWKSLGHN